MRLKVKFLVIAQHNLLEVFIYINLIPLIYYEQCTHTFVIFVVIKKQIIWKTDKSLTNCSTKRKLNTGSQKPQKI